MSPYPTLFVLCLLVFTTPSNGLQETEPSPTTPSPTTPSSTTPSTTKDHFSPFAFIEMLGGDVRNLGKSLLTDIVLSATKTVNLTLDSACKTVCANVCKLPLVGTLCTFVCSPRCMRRKRSIREHVKDGEHLRPMPNLFSAYDIDEDGAVSPKELAFATGQDLQVDSFMKIFTMADKDGNKLLSPEELYEGPFVFEMDVSDDDQMFCRYMMYRMNRLSASGKPARPKNV